MYYCNTKGNSDLLVSLPFLSVPLRWNAMFDTPVEIVDCWKDKQRLSSDDTKGVLKQWILTFPNDKSR